MGARQNMSLDLDVHSQKRKRTLYIIEKNCTLYLLSYVFAYANMWCGGCVVYEVYASVFSFCVMVF